MRRFEFYQPEGDRPRSPLPGAVIAGCGRELLPQLIQRLLCSLALVFIQGVTGGGVHWLEHIIRHTLVNWGYWAVLAGLLGENAGVPLPGETVLMFASFLAHKNTGLKIEWVIVAGTSAAILGDNLAYLLGHKLGRRLIRWMKKLFHMDDEDVGAAKDQMRRHGAATVFWARYIFGLRTIAGPLAGVLGMEWKKFVVFNALGAVTWVTAMAMLGYAFADRFNTLLDYFERLSWAMAAGLFLLGYLLWRRQKKRYKERVERKKAA